jgi:multicomponent Na+:H+ antiporter subunit B
MFDFIESLNGLLLILILITASGVLVLRSLFAATMLLSLYSLLMALVWLNLDAVDVAFTEAAVGAGISTLLLIGALVVVGFEEKPHPTVHWPALLVVIVTAAALGYGTLDMPALGDPQAPVHQSLAPEYIAQTVQKQVPASHASSADEGDGHADASANASADTHDNYFHGHVPNLVTSVIVTYRAYDTLFEVAVIFTAGISLILLLRQPEEPSQ